MDNNFIVMGNGWEATQKSSVYALFKCRNTYIKIEICLNANIGVQIKPVFQSKKIGQILPLK